MGNQNTVAVPGGVVNASQSLFNAFSADSYIYQQACGITSHIDTVSAAAAGYTTKIHNMSSFSVRSEDKYELHLHHYIIGNHSALQRPLPEAGCPSAF